MSKKSIVTTICESCDSEFEIKFKKESVDGTPSYCPFCGEETGFMDEDGLSDDDFNSSPDDEEWQQ